MVGTVIIIVVLAVVFPIVINVAGLVGSALFGWLLKRDVDLEHQGSELLELSERRP